MIAGSLNVGLQTDHLGVIVKAVATTEVVGFTFSEMTGDQQRGATAERLLEMRAARRKSFPAELFNEHAWDILLHLFIALADNKTISEAALIETSGTNARVAGRWLDHLVAVGLIGARQDGKDVALTANAISCMRTFLDATHDIKRT